MVADPSFSEARNAVIVTLERAADTLRRLPMPAYGKPAQLLSSWPHGSLDLSSDQGAGDASRSIRRPDARSISELDRVLPWLSGLDTADRRLVWARASGVSWPRLGRKFGMTVGQVRYRWNRTIDHVVAMAVNDTIRSGR